MVEKIEALEKEQKEQGKDITIISKAVSKLLAEKEKLRSAIGFEIWLFQDILEVRYNTIYEMEVFHNLSANYVLGTAHFDKLSYCASSDFSQDYLYNSVWNNWRTHIYITKQFICSHWTRGIPNALGNNFGNFIYTLGNHRNNMGPDSL